MTAAFCPPACQSLPRFVCADDACARSLCLCSASRMRWREWWLRGGTTCAHFRGSVHLQQASWLAWFKHPLPTNPPPSLYHGKLVLSRSTPPHPHPPLEKNPHGRRPPSRAAPSGQLTAHANPSPSLVFSCLSPSPRPRERPSERGGFPAVPSPPMCSQSRRSKRRTGIFSHPSLLTAQGRVWRARPQYPKRAIG